MRSKVLLKAQVIDYSKQLGFLDIRFAQAGFMEQEAKRLEAWLNSGAHGKMGYMENHFDKRVDPTKLVPGAKTVISLSYNYFNPSKQDTSAPKLSMYAYGKDYHHIIKAKLRQLYQFIEEKTGTTINGRCFVDSAPVLERDWAKRAGLGWIGKNTLLLSKKTGSFFFLAEIILDVPFEPDSPVTDHCGTCRKCIDACPTDAISENGYSLDAKKCISYLTIELKEALPEGFKGKMDNWMFGCDICQTVCPWNRFSTKHNEPAFEPHPDLLKMTKKDWMALERETFNEVFRKSAVKRTKFEGLTRNIAFSLEQ